MQPRETMRALPRPVQPFLTWVTGVPLAGAGPRVRWRPVLAAVAGVVQICAGIALGALGLGSAWYLTVPLLLTAWPLTAGGMRRLDVVVVHQTLHRMFARSAAANRIVSEIVTTVLWRRAYDPNRTEHLLHHAHPCSLKDEDTLYLRDTGARPGMSRREFRRYLLRACLSPKHHWGGTTGRLKANLLPGHQPAYRLAMSLGWLAGTVTLVTLNGWWLEWLVLWVVPVTFFFQNQTFLYTLSEHRWWLFDNAERLTKAERDQLTFGRFCGRPAPRTDGLGTAARLAAWTGWWLRMLLVYAPYRMVILVGDTVQHDLHHIRPTCDWANSSWVRNEQLERHAGRYFEAWGGLLTHVYVGNSVRDFTASSSEALPPRPAAPSGTAPRPRRAVASARAASQAAPAAAEVPAGAGTVLVVDSTGRGHALCRLFTANDPAVTVHYGPGCDLIEDDRIVPVPSLSLTDVTTVLDHLAAHPAEFVLVSNIDALSLGYVDELRRAGHRVIGPVRAAAELESSKARGKRFCVDHGIPVATHAVFTDAAEARRYIRDAAHLCVVKTDGLTPDGDGSVVCDSAAEALAAVDRFAEQQGEQLRLVVEERLTGQEVSVFALLDGRGALMFPPAMDFKRTFDGDRGVNCDGMGSIAPHPADSPALREMLRAAVLDPLVRGLHAEELDFTGFVYVGAMLTADGPRVIEINARFGDSEAEVVLPGVRSDFTALCRAVLAGTVTQQELETDGLARCSVALVQGTPGADTPLDTAGWPYAPPAVGQPVTGLDRVDPEEAVLLYANLARGEDGTPVTRGGRVLHVVGTGATPAEARRRAYGQVDRVSFPGMRHRTDIGATAGSVTAPFPAPQDMPQEPAARGAAPPDPAPVASAAAGAAPPGTTEPTLAGSHPS